MLSTETATTAGTVDGFLVDAATAQVVALRLKKAPGRGDTQHWQDLESFGVDHVTITAPDVISEPRGRAAEHDTKASELIGKRILTDTGDEFGTVTDVDLDNGAVISLVSIYGSRLVRRGSYADIVRNG